MFILFRNRQNSEEFGYFGRFNLVVQASQTLTAKRLGENAFEYVGVWESWK